MEWLWAGAAIVGGLVAGVLFSKIIGGLFARRKGRLEQLAGAASSLTFSLLLVVGLLVALGFVQPTSLEQLRDDTINYLPRALSALIVVILGGVVGTIASTAVRESIGRGMGRLGTQLPTVLKAMITTFAVILAASQLGIDTTVINIVVAAAAFGIALAFAMIVGVGSRPIAAEVSSGRALKRLVVPGDSIQSSAAHGLVVAMHATAVEVQDAAGNIVLLPNSELSESGFRITRGARPEVSQDD